MSETTTLSLRVVGELTDGHTREDLQQHVTAVADFLLPGCTASGILVANGEGGHTTLVATLLAQTTPLPESAGYGEQVPDAEFLTAYILGADHAWIRGAQTMFVPSDVTVTAK